MVVEWLHSLKSLSYKFYLRNCLSLDTDFEVSGCKLKHTLSYYCVISSS